MYVKRNDQVNETVFPAVDSIESEVEQGENVYGWVLQFSGEASDKDVLSEHPSQKEPSEDQSREKEVSSAVEEE